MTLVTSDVSEEHSPFFGPLFFRLRADNEAKENFLGLVWGFEGPGIVP